MGQVFEGNLSGQGLRFAIVASRFNGFITEKLLAGAQDTLRRHGVAEADIDVAWVPGAFEIPLAAQKLAQRGQYAGVIALGAVIRGATAHFDHVSNQASRGVGQVMQETGVPVGFGVLTTDTIEQAIERAGTKMGNAGAQAALSALEMANLLKELA